MSTQKMDSIRVDLFSFGKKFILLMPQTEKCDRIAFKLNCHFGRKHSIGDKPRNNLFELINSIGRRHIYLINCKLVTMMEKQLKININFYLFNVVRIFFFDKCS